MITGFILLIMLKSHAMKNHDLILIDCRPLSDFVLGHQATACNLPADELPQRMHELPDSAQAITLAGNADAVAQANDFLVSKGYVVQRLTIYDETHITQLKQQGDWHAGTESQRLWQPSPLIDCFVHELMPLHGIKAGKGLDIGCGSGRDLVYCAMHGWQMTGVDVQPAAVARAQALARSQHVTIETQTRDLETGADPFADIADGSVDLISIARYLHRPLFPVIQRLLAKGGVIVYHTFMVGSEAFGSPKNPKFLLKAGELAAVFSDAEILLDEVVTLADGRPMSMFVARTK
jgi:SAM-dependent methyltransferase